MTHVIHANRFSHFVNTRTAENTTGGKDETNFCLCLSNPTVAPPLPQRITRADLTKLKVQVRCAVVVPGAGQHQLLPRRRLKASVRLVEELSPV